MLCQLINSGVSKCLSLSFSQSSGPRRCSTLWDVMQRSLVGCSETSAIANVRCVHPIKAKISFTTRRKPQIKQYRKCFNSIKRRASFFFVVVGAGSVKVIQTSLLYYNLTLGPVCATIVAVEKQYVLRMLNMCL